jgi:hypothetical protein
MSTFLQNWLERRAMSAPVGGGGGLPAGYTRIEYLKGTGVDTWINTGFVPVQDDIRVIVDADVMSGAGDNVLFYVYTGNLLNVDWYSISRVYYRFLGFETINFNTTDARHIIELGPTCKLDGVTVATATPTRTLVGNGSPIILFGLPLDTTLTPSGVRAPFKGKMYEFSVYYGDTLMAHLLPVRDDNNVGYMYDTVRNLILPNSGNGSFTLGQDIV